MRRSQMLAMSRTTAEGLYKPQMPITGGGGPGSVNVQPNYYIDPVHGNDNNSGTSPNKALKTYAALQEIFGRYTTLFLPFPAGPQPTYADIEIINLSPSIGGQILVQTATPIPASWVTGATINVSSLARAPDFFPPIVGTNEALGNWVMKRIDSTHILLEGSHFVNAYGGGGAVNAPIAKIVTIFLLNDLPPDDPITFFNFVGRDTVVVVQGTSTILHSGTIQAVQTEDPATNTPWTMIDPSVASWAPDLFIHQIQITSGAAGPITVPGNPIGARAWPAVDLGGGQVQVSEWCQSDPAGNFPLANWLVGATFYAPVAPAPGDQYQVVAFTQAVLGICLVGYDSSSSQTQAMDGIAFGGFAIQNIHLVSPPVTAPAPDALTAEALDGMNPLNNAAVMGFGDIVFDNTEITFNGGYTFLVNPSFIGFPSFLGPAQSNGTFWTFGAIGASPTGSPVDFEAGSTTLMDGNISFYGDGFGADAGMLIGGFGLGGSAFIESGPISFWNNVFLSFQLYATSTLDFPLFSPLFGNNGYVPIYGNCPEMAPTFSNGIINENSQVNIRCFVNTTAQLVVPTLATGGAFDIDFGPQRTGASTSNVATSGQAYAFDITTGTSVPGLRPFTWAGLITPIGGGGFQQAQQTLGFFPPTSYDAIGGAYRPDSPGAVVYEALVIPGP